MRPCSCGPSAIATPGPCFCTVTTCSRCTRWSWVPRGPQMPSASTHCCAMAPSSPSATTVPMGLCRPP
ncbi:hypothetical protein ACFFX0_07985 [Citricoccus parietis]|uniref:Uncharacterized protein n=1 Tax=Citricoccus parietis TaxID=592307 RepID=A0ABV5FWU6_9MICC